MKFTVSRFPLNFAGMQGVRCPKTDEVDEVDATRAISDGVGCGVNFPINFAVDIPESDPDRPLAGCTY